MRRRILSSKNEGNWRLPDGSKANVLDVVFANKTTEELIIDGMWTIEKYPSSEYEPIGIVVIPGNHGVLKDGNGVVNQCGIISIVPMNYNTPEKGDTTYEQTMRWGYNVDIIGKSDGLGRYDSYNGNGLQNYDIVCHVGNKGKVNETIQGTSKIGTLPSDNFTTVKNPYDNGTYYYYNNDYYYAPSPYNNDGTYNSNYGQTTEPSSSNNALSDFKGIVNTKIITDLSTGQRDWKTASAITNSSGSTYYPPACCCARFKTTGTKAFVDCSVKELRNGTGFWYLPACGELGYIIPKLKQINQTISALNNAYYIPNSAYRVGLELGSGVYSKYWSSTDVGDGIVRGVSMSDGYVGQDAKVYNYHVRAFMRL